METNKCFALVVQKDDSEEMEIVFTSQFKTPCIEENLKLNRDKGNNSFITKLFSNTITYQEEWIKKFNTDRNKNIAWKKANGY
tara:strand:- start:289 stop:537 length:249 start_codon:yes stop_codon:yes gene_type:complete